MPITLLFLSDYLSETYPNLRVYTCASHSLRGVRMYRRENTQLSEDICYICKSQKRLDDVDPRKSYILIGGDPEIFHNINRIVIEDDVSASILYEEILDIFDMINRWKDDLREAVAAGESIQYLVERSEAIFGYNPIIVQNTSQQILGYIQSSGPGASIPYWKNIADQQFVAGTVDSMVLLKSLHKRMITSQTVFFDKACAYENDLRVLRAGVLSKENYLYGHITISQYTGKLKNCHMELIRFLAKQITAVLNRDASRLNYFGTIGPAFLLDALTSESDHPEMQEKGLDILGWRPNDCYQIIALHFRQNSHNLNVNYQNIRFYFSQFLPRAQVLLIDKQAIVICNSKASPVLGERLLSQLHELLLFEIAACGISAEFCDFSDVKIYFRQAKYACSCAENGQIRCYESCMVDDMLSNYVQCWGTGGIHSDIRKLQAQDKSQSSQLLKTLYYYLLCDRSFNRCSDLLHIHRSTFRYRLNQIREVISSDLDDPENRLALILSARLAMQESVNPDI